jgi:hypothetical protein
MREIGFVDLIEFVKECHITQKGSDLDNSADVTSCLRQNRLNTLAASMSLLCDTSWNYFSIGVNRNLPRQKDI